MSARRRTALSVLGVLALSTAVALRTPLGIDYDDDAQGAIDALRAGDWHAFAAHQPLMGSFSLLLRAPFAKLAELGDPSALWTYRLGVLPCLLAAGILGLALARGRPALTAFLLLNPITLFALLSGHPEEILGAALCVGAVLAAAAGRPWLAVALLGCAVATKQWALVALAPVLLALPARARLRATVAAGALAAALTVPLALANWDKFTDVLHNAASPAGQAHPFSVWWALTGVAGAPGPITRTLILGAPLVLALVWARRRPAPPLEAALRLLALALLLRCALDPLDNPYYHVPFLVALAAWETTARGRAPWLAIASSLVLWVDALALWSHGRPGATNAVYLAWALAMAAVLLAPPVRRPEWMGHAADRASRHGRLLRVRRAPSPS